MNCRPPEEGEGVECEGVEGEGVEVEGGEGEGGEVEGVEVEGGEGEGVEVEGGEVVDGTQAATVVIRPSVEGPSTHWPFGWAVISKCVKNRRRGLGRILHQGEISTKIGDRRIVSPLASLPTQVYCCH